MAIIQGTTGTPYTYNRISAFPNMFVTEKEKAKDTWIKEVMDYFTGVATLQYLNKRKRIIRNYRLANGFLTFEDFYGEDERENSFVKNVIGKQKLPSHIKNYSILSTPMNKLMGELTRRPLSFKVKAYDDDSKSEELKARTSVLISSYLSTLVTNVLASAGDLPEDFSKEEFIASVKKQVEEELDNYTSAAEEWGNNIVSALSAEFNIKELSEEAFMDLWLTGEQYYEIYEDTSKIGFNIRQVPAKNVWDLASRNKKYTSDPSGRLDSSYAVGTIETMELSEIMQTFKWLTQEEIDHLRDIIGRGQLIYGRKKDHSVTGDASITYDTYDPLARDYYEIIASEVLDHELNSDVFEMFRGEVDPMNRFVVVKAYFIGKKKIGKLTYLDEMGMPQEILVDENYKSGDLETEISLEWAWINQLYKGVRIGLDIYHIEPLSILDYMPIIGTKLPRKHVGQPYAPFDLMKPFQILYNICMNQIFELLEKEIGNVASIELKAIPPVKDEGDERDALEIMETEAKIRGIITFNSTPSPGVNIPQPIRPIPLDRTAEISARFQLAEAIREQCWTMFGFPRQRMGQVFASERASNARIALTESYVQTEWIFTLHEYVLFRLYQAILDVAKVVESRNPLSTISYINSHGISHFISVTPEDLKFRDLKIFPTNRTEDIEEFNNVKQAVMAVAQGTQDFVTVIDILTTNSVRELKKAAKRIQARIEENIARQQQQMQMQTEAEMQKEQQRMQTEAYTEEAQRIHDAYQRQLDRIKDERVAMIYAGASKSKQEDYSALDKEYNKYMAKLEELRLRYGLAADKMDIEREKLKIARENMKNDLEVARIQAEARKRNRNRNQE
jgi:hypothetical protein